MSLTRRMFQLGMAAALLAAGLVLLPAVVMAADGEPLARMGAGAAAIEWHPLVSSYESMVLTVSTPGGSVVRREFKAGETPSFSAFTGKGNARPDGVYTYELRVVPVVDPATREKLRAYRESGDRSILAEVAGKLPRGASVQSGSFTIAGGAFLSSDGVEPRNVQKGLRSTGGKALTNVTAADQVIPDDLIVQQSLCVGFDCVNNESFGFDTVRLKENNTRIKFEDTSTGTFPTNDWQLTANDSASGGASKFSIEDITGAKVPFTVTAGASTNSIFVDSTGRVGFRTSTPVLDLHVATSNTPALRLEQNNSGGFTAQTWDVAGNEANFFVRDVTGGSRLPFRIRPGAPTSSLDISADGDVGIGTASPNAKLHLLVTTAPATQRQLFLAENNGGTEFGLKDTSTGVEWVWQNVNNEMRFTDRGDAVNEFVLLQNGNATFGGTVTPGSSRAIKEDFSPVDSRDMLRRVLNLDITSWSYKAAPGERHVGPMSEDFYATFAVGGDKGISVTDSAGVAFAAIQGLHQELAERDAEIADLRSKLEALAARLEQIDATP